MATETARSLATERNGDKMGNQETVAPGAEREFVVRFERLGRSSMGAPPVLRIRHSIDPLACVHDVEQAIERAVKKRVMSREWGYQFTLPDDDNPTGDVSIEFGRFGVGTITIEDAQIGDSK